MRHLRLHDLPFLYRMVGQGVSLDTQLNLTVGQDWLSQAVLSGIGRVQPYVMRRSEDERGYGVLRFPSDGQHAWLSYLAPSLMHNGSLDLLLQLMDGLTEQAGAQGAVNLISEVDACSVEFELLRHGGFGTYERQSIWLRRAKPVSGERNRVREATRHDQPAIMSLYRSLVPALIKQVEPPPIDAHTCYLLEDSYGGIKGVLAVLRGIRASLIDVYLKPEASTQAVGAMHAVLDDLQADDRPVYCRLRHYASGWSTMLDTVGFEHLVNQAVMVRHTAARVKSGVLHRSLTVDGGIPVMTPFSDI